VENDELAQDHCVVFFDSYNRIKLLKAGFLEKEIENKKFFYIFGAVTIYIGVVFGRK